MAGTQRGSAGARGSGGFTSVTGIMVSRGMDPKTSLSNLPTVNRAKWKPMPGDVLFLEAANGGMPIPAMVGADGRTVVDFQMGQMRRRSLAEVRGSIASVRRGTKPAAPSRPRSASAKVATPSRMVAPSNQRGSAGTRGSGGFRNVTDVMVSRGMDPKTGLSNLPTVNRAKWKPMPGDVLFLAAGKGPLVPAMVSADGKTVIDFPNGQMRRRSLADMDASSIASVRRGTKPVAQRSFADSPAGKRQARLEKSAEWSGPGLAAKEQELADYIYHGGNDSHRLLDDLDAAGYNWDKKLALKTYNRVLSNIGQFRDPHMSTNLGKYAYSIHKVTRENPRPITSGERRAIRMSEDTEAELENNLTPLQKAALNMGKGGDVITAFQKAGFARDSSSKESLDALNSAVNSAESMKGEFGQQAQAFVRGRLEEAMTDARQKKDAAAMARIADLQNRMSGDYAHMRLDSSGSLGEYGRRFADTKGAPGLNGFLNAAGSALGNVSGMVMEAAGGATSRKGLAGNIPVIGAIRTGENTTTSDFMDTMRADGVDPTNVAEVKGYLQSAKGRKALRDAKITGAATGVAQVLVDVATLGVVPAGKALTKGAAEIVEPVGKKVMKEVLKPLERRVGEFGPLRVAGQLIKDGLDKTLATPIGSKAAKAVKRFGKAAGKAAGRVAKRAPTLKVAKAARTAQTKLVDAAGDYVREAGRETVSLSTGHRTARRLAIGVARVVRDAAQDGATTAVAPMAHEVASQFVKDGRIASVRDILNAGAVPFSAAALNPGRAVHRMAQSWGDTERSILPEEESRRVGRVVVDNRGRDVVFASKEQKAAYDIVRAEEKEEHLAKLRREKAIREHRPIPVKQTSKKKSKAAPLTPEERAHNKLVYMDVNMQVQHGGFRGLVPLVDNTQPGGHAGASPGPRAGRDHDYESAYMRKGQIAIADRVGRRAVDDMLATRATGPTGDRATRESMMARVMSLKESGSSRKLAEAEALVRKLAKQYGMSTVEVWREASSAHRRSSRKTTDVNKKQGTSPKGTASFR